MKRWLVVILCAVALAVVVCLSFVSVRAVSSFSFFEKFSGQLLDQMSLDQVKFATSPGVVVLLTGQDLSSEKLRAAFETTRQAVEKKLAPRCLGVETSWNVRQSDSSARMVFRIDEREDLDTAVSDAIAAVTEIMPNLPPSVRETGIRVVKQPGASPQPPVAR